VGYAAKGHSGAEGHVEDQGKAEEGEGVDMKVQERTSRWRGDAGTGKSALVKESVRLLKNTEKGRESCL